MLMSVRHRALSGALAGAALLLAGCAVPGQAGAPGTAAAFHGEALTNDRVTQLQEAWQDEAAAPASRRNVITLELMREPLAAATDQIGYEYHRSQAEQQAELVLQTQGIEDEPSEALVDAMEASFLIAAFTLLPEDTSVLQSVAEEVEADAATSQRSGQFSAEAFMTTAAQAVQVATQEANAGSPTWVVNFNTVNGLVPADAPWLATE